MSEQVEVFNIVKTSNEEARFESFKITVDRECYDKLCGDNAPLFWPQNIYCRPFVKKKADTPRRGTF